MPVRVRSWFARPFAPLKTGPAFADRTFNRADAALPALAAAVVAAAAILLVQSGDITAGGYRLNQLERLKADRERQNQQLAADIARLQSLDRIDSEARSRWKMEPATRVLYVELEAGTSAARTER